MKITKKVFRAAFRSSIPVMMGYFAMGSAAGILLAKEVPEIFAPLWAFLTAATSISGALQFLTVDFYQKHSSLLDLALITIFINIRYAMYGFSLLSRFHNIPFWHKCYLIWTLTDETFALEVENKVPAGEDAITYCTILAALNHGYWMIGTTAGAIIGNELPFNSRGIDFAMTALFIVILVDQCRERSNLIPACIGGGAAIAARLFFPSRHMLIPTIILMIAIFLILRKKLDRQHQGKAA